MNPDIPLLLFAKAPIPGQVKTRLQTHCSAEQAADIARILMEASIQQATRHWPGTVYLSVWLDHEHEFFKKMQARYPIRMSRQREGDLGIKMQLALQDHGYPAAVMGCDAPQITAQTLRKAHQLLCHGKSVIGPSEDGGYYLLGLAQACDTLFQDQQWGSSSVLNQTLRTAAGIQFELSLLDSLNDVDEWSDLVQAAAELPALADYLQSNNLTGA